jgi:hypothetical protein
MDKSIIFEYLLYVISIKEPEALKDPEKSDLTVKVIKMM